MACLEAERTLRHGIGRIARLYTNYVATLGFEQIASARIISACMPLALLRLSLFKYLTRLKSPD